jgi:peroxin-6
MLKAITRQARNVDAKVADHNKTLSQGSLPISVAYFFDHFATEEDTAVLVVEEDFEHAKRELVPSVSKDELWHYERVRRAFEGATIGAKDKEKTNSENANNRNNSNKSPNPTVPVPPVPTEKDRRGSWMKQAKDRIKGRSLSRGRGTGSGAGAQIGGGIAQAGSRGKSRLGPGSQTSSDGPESMYRVSSSGSMGKDGAADEEEDEYVIKTDHLKSNGAAVGSGKGKAKGKSANADDFGDAAGDDEEMYV